MQPCYSARLFVSRPLLLLKCFVVAILLCGGIDSALAKPSFKQWLTQLEQEAIKEGVSQKTAKATIKHIRQLSKVVKLDQKQPEFVTTFQGYYHSHVTPKRVRIGRKKQQHYRALLSSIERQYGIPPTILLALWGLETNYGSFKGDIDTVSALATLAYDGRREAFFKAQLFDAMWIIDHYQLPFSYLSGSWAGAFGHLQFMPSTFKRFAINGDNNTRIDIKRSVPDAMYSAANYLSTVGWRAGMPSAVQVKLPSGFPYHEAQLNHRKSLSEWQAMGVQAISAHLGDYQFAQNHRAYKKQSRQKQRQYRISRIRYQSLSTIVNDQSAKAAILLPQGWRGPAFMVFENFDTILDWNRSVNYALSVSFLAQQLADQVVVAITDNNDKTALSRLQMKRLQKLLKKFGYDPGPVDGYPGLKTQAAIRAFQKDELLPADGYASLQLYYHLDRRFYQQLKQSSN